MATLHHYIPAQRLSDSVYGFYDLITGNFLTSATSTPFLGGVATTGHNLPAEYEEVEYISSVGDNYVDTGYVANMDTLVKCDYEPISLANANRALYGSRGGTTGSYRSWYDTMINNQATNNYHAGYENTDVYTGPTSGRHVIRQERNKFYLDDTLVRTITVYTDPWSTTNEMFIFALNGNGSASNFISAKIYEFVIAENEFTPEGGINLYYNGNKVENLYYNGNKVETLYHNSNLAG